MTRVLTLPLALFIEVLLSTPSQIIHQHSSTSNYFFYKLNKKALNIKVGRSPLDSLFYFEKQAYFSPPSLYKDQGHKTRIVQGTLQCFYLFKRLSENEEILRFCKIALFFQTPKPCGRNGRNEKKIHDAKQTTVKRRCWCN